MVSFKKVSNMTRDLRDFFYSYVPTKYIDSHQGNTNMIITAPHGGGMKPVFIPNRTKGILVMDTYTRRLTRRLLEYYDSWHTPYYLISEIHRKKVDFNRSVDEGTQGNKKAIELWNLWNTLLIHFYNNAKGKYNKVLYVDIHSHNNSDEFHLGYNLRYKHYKLLLDNPTARVSTSLHGLGFNQHSMIFGSSSFQYTIESMGYKVFTPNNEDTYFSGGRNIKVYSGTGVGAIQIEVPVSILSTEFDRVAYTLKLAIQKFRKEFAPAE